MNRLRLLKAASRGPEIRRAALPDWSAPTESPPSSQDFVPLALPHVRLSIPQSHSEPCLGSVLTALQSAVEQVHAQRDRWLEESQCEAVRLGIAIAERLLRRTLDAHPDAILDLIRTALDWTARAERLRVRLHPVDTKLVESASANLSRDADCDIEFVADETLARGDCVIDTPNGQTNARLDVVLQRLADELLVR